MAIEPALWIRWLELSAGIPLLAYAAAHDVAVRIIPDTIPASLGILGLCARMARTDLPAGLLAAALVATACFLCWWRGWFGGGDAKLLAALALLLPPGRVLPAVVAVAWCGAVLALPYLALRRPRHPTPGPRPRSLLARVWRAERFRLRRGGPLPYGLAIAAGGILELLQQ